MGSMMDGTTPQNAQLFNDIIAAARGQGYEPQGPIDQEWPNLMKAAAQSPDFGTDEGIMALTHAAEQMNIPRGDIWPGYDEGAPDYAGAGPDPMGEEPGAYMDDGEGGADYVPEAPDVPPMPGQEVDESLLFPSPEDIQGMHEMGPEAYVMSQEALERPAKRMKPKFAPR